MKWLFAGFALAATSLAAGLACIILGYRQVICRYLEAGQTPGGQLSSEK